MKGSEIESESEKGRAVGWGGGRDCCWWLGCTCDIRRYLRAKKNVHDIRCHYRIATGHLVAYPSEVVEEWGGARLCPRPWYGTTMIPTLPCFSPPAPSPQAPPPALPAAPDLTTVPLVCARLLLVISLLMY